MSYGYIKYLFKNITWSNHPTDDESTAESLGCLLIDLHTLGEGKQIDAVVNAIKHISRIILIL